MGLQARPNRSDGPEEPPYKTGNDTIAAVSELDSFSLVHRPVHRTSPVEIAAATGNIPWISYCGTVF